MECPHNSQKQMCVCVCVCVAKSTHYSLQIFILSVSFQKKSAEKQIWASEPSALVIL